MMRRPYLVYKVLIDIWNRIPQNIAMICLYENSSLADSHLLPLARSVHVCCEGLIVGTGVDLALDGEDSAVMLVLNPNIVKILRP